MSARKFAFVVPRFLRNNGGGAEMLCGALARKLMERGDQIEIWTTCAADNRTWDNALPVGEEDIDGLIVKRFSVDPRNLESWVPLQIAISEGMSVEIDDQVEWMAQSVNSSGLYEHIALHASECDLVFFAPYLFGTTFWGAQIVPDKSCLIPCLHDEKMAYAELFGIMFQRVKGSLFNAGAEQRLAESLYGRLVGGEVGMGFDPLEYQKGHLPYLPQGTNYLLYVGRKETGKNAHLLIDLFTACKDSGALQKDLKLVFVGGGDFKDLHRPNALERDDIINLPHVSEAEKKGLIEHALALCQPSTNESFSIVIMEAWLLGTPVMVHSACAVTREHVTRSGGGFYFSDKVDFCGSLQYLLNNPELRAQLASGGESYVRDYYSWEAVLNRFDQVVDNILSNKSGCSDDATCQ